MGAPIELFCCYSREDEDDLKKLFQQLRALERANLIHVWYDRAINPGENWEEAIHTHLDDAQMILLIVSASFIASDQCYDKEMPRALARHESGHARVLPILLHPCDWKITPLGRFQVLPTDGQPISLWPKQNSALLNIIEGVKRMANELQVEMLLKAGLAHYDAERYDEALAIFDQALLRAQPQEEPIVPASFLARLYQGKGDAYFLKKSLLDETWKNTIADALTNYEKALHSDNSLLHSHEQKGRALFYLERYKEAISSLEEALMRGSLDPDVFFCKYETLLQLNRTDEALTFYEQVYGQWPSWDEPHLKAAQLFENEGHFEQALVIWERVISLIPNQSEGYLGKARVLEGLERYVEALEVYEQARAMKLNTAQLSLQKGLLLELLGRDQEAMIALDEAMQIQSDTKQDDILGPVHFGQQRLYERLAKKTRTRVQSLGYRGHYRLFRTLRVNQGAKSILDVRGGTRGMALSPDGHFLAGGNYNQTIKLWDLSSGNELSTLKVEDNEERHDEGVFCVAFSPDGGSLAGSSVRTIRFWDLLSGNERPSLLRYTDTTGPIHFAFSPDGRFLASCQDKTIRLWDLSSGKILRTFGHTQDVGSIAFSPDGRFLASGCHGETFLVGDVRLWDVSSGKVLQIFSRGGCKIAFNPDGHSLASGGGYRNTVKLWDLFSGKILHTFSGNVYCVAFSPDGRSLAIGDDGPIRLWDISSGAERQTLKGHTDAIWDVVFSPDGYTLASGSRDGTIKLWRLL